MELRNEDFQFAEWDEAEFIKNIQETTTAQMMPTIAKKHTRALTEKEENLAFFGYYVIVALTSITSIFTIYSATAKASAWSHSIFPAVGTLLVSVAIGFGVATGALYLVRSLVRQHQNKTRVHNYQFGEPTESIRGDYDYVRIVRPNSAELTEEKVAKKKAL